MNIANDQMDMCLDQLRERGLLVATYNGDSETLTTTTVTKVVVSWQHATGDYRSRGTIQLNCWDGEILQLGVSLETRVSGDWVGTGGVDFDPDADLADAFYAACRVILGEALVDTQPNLKLC